MAEEELVIGVIGGSGLYELDSTPEAPVEVLEKKRLKTPFGDPSDEFIICRINGTKVNEQNVDGSYTTNTMFLRFCGACI